MAPHNNPPLDIAIIGSGPAALTAALYAARENLSVTVYERNIIGGLASTIGKIDNFPAFFGTGAQLSSSIRAQAETFGAKITYGNCTAIQKTDNIFNLTIDNREVSAKSVIIATGSEPRKLGIPGQDQPNISYCATCDAPLTKGKKVIVIGGGNSAVGEAFHLLKYASSVTLISRSPLRASSTLKNRLKKEPRITVHIGPTPQEFIHKKAKLTALKTTHQTFPADFAFIFIGNTPATSFLPTSILTPDGYIATDHTFSTTIPGLLAAGDCRAGSTKQVITASGEGASAAISASKYLSSLK